MLGAVAKVLGDEGIVLENSTAFLEPLLAKSGVLTSRPPSAEEQRNIDYGRAVARHLAQYDIGQTVVVAESACVAVEAMEGTDATIERASQLMSSLAGDASTLSPRAYRRQDREAQSRYALRCAGHRHQNHRCHARRRSHLPGRSTRANACSSTETECEMPRTKPKSPSSPPSRNPESALLAEQLRNAFEGDAWHGPAVLELLADIDPETAAAHPLPETHSIWEIALHIAAWDDAVNRRIVLGKFGKALQLNAAENFPPVTDKSAAAWKKAVAHVKAAHAALLETVAGLPDARLRERVPGKKYDIGFMLQGVAAARDLPRRADRDPEKDPFVTKATATNLRYARLRFVSTIQWRRQPAAGNSPWTQPVSSTSSWWASAPSAATTPAFTRNLSSRASRSAYWAWSIVTWRAPMWWPAEFNCRSFGSLDQLLTTHSEVQAASVTVPTVDHLAARAR